MNARSNHRTRSRASRAGQAMVEFAISATSLLSLMFGLMFLGSAVYSYNTLSEAAREAVRYAIVHPPPTGATSSQIQTADSQVQQIAMSYAAGLNLTSSDIAVTWPADPSISKRNDAEVQITYPYTLRVPFIGKISLNLTSTSRMLLSQ